MIPSYPNSVTQFNGQAQMTVQIQFNRQFLFIYCMHKTRVSVISGHNLDSNTDHLYEPLRKTFLQDTTAKKTYLEDVSRFSHISHLAKIHNFDENHELGERTLIPEDRRLFRKDHVNQFPDSSRYYIINAEQKQYDPISPDQLEFRLRNQPQQEQKILYSYENDEMSVTSTFDPPAKRKSPKLKVTQAKYNLFSLIDEPCNNILSGRSCTCPGNQIIASNKNEIAWDMEDN